MITKTPIDEVRDLFARAVKWECVTTHTTTRGRVKTIATGVPEEIFWYRYKSAGLRAKMQDIGLTLKRHQKGKWEVICWVRPLTRVLLEELGLVFPATVESAEPQTATSDPF